MQIMDFFLCVISVLMIVFVYYLIKHTLFQICALFGTNDGLLHLY